MVSALVNDEGPSNKEEPRVSGSSGPGTSERVFLATRTSRVTTPEVVLGTTERLFLPEGHPFLRSLDRSLQVEGSSGVVSASSSGPLLYHLELRVPIDTLEGDALVSSLLKGSSSSTRSDTILPAFRIRVETFRMVLGPTSLEEATPHLFVHGIRHCLRFLVLDLPNLHQLRHNLLSGLEGPLIAILLIRVTWTRWRYGELWTCATSCWWRNGNRLG